MALTLRARLRKIERMANARRAQRALRHARAEAKCTITIEQLREGYERYCPKILATPGLLTERYREWGVIGEASPQTPRAPTPTSAIVWKLTPNHLP